jgi:threonine dehydrogenase-like Zn-dependent dehydrogenase
MGPEFIGKMEAVGADVRTVKVGDIMAAPFAVSDGTCVVCQQGPQNSCFHGSWWGDTEIDGGQGEAVPVTYSYAPLGFHSVGRDDALMPSLPTLTDVRVTSDPAITPP